MSPTNETHVSVEADEGQSAGHDDDEVKEETATTALALFEEGQQQSEEEQEQKEDSKLGCAFIIGALTTFLCGKCKNRNFVTLSHRVTNPQSAVIVSYGDERRSC